jgi:hypothetical protein
MAVPGCLFENSQNLNQSLEMGIELVIELGQYFIGG